MDIQNPLDVALHKMNNRDNDKGKLLLSGDI
jgi:hypothetical protein